MTSPLFGTHRPTEEFPMFQRAGLRFLRRMANAGVATFAGIGARMEFLRQMLLGFAYPRTFGPQVIAQMRSVGVASLPLTVTVAAFIGAVIALQTRYQLFPGIQLSVVGLIARQSIVLELGPLLTGLVLTGRVGARMTAELGTMRVTEQIDALETLAFNPMAYLVIPRVLAGVIMLPLLVIFADAVGVGMAFFTAIFATDVTWNQFSEGLRLSFSTFQVFYSLLKGMLFGAAIAFLCSYEGYTADVGAEGVGRSTASAVVITSVVILVLDALIAILLAPYLQG